VWESSLAALFAELHPDKIATVKQIPRFVNPFCPDHFLLSTRAELQFSAAVLSSSSSVATFFGERDFGRSIDILVLGLQSDGRSELYRRLVEVALENDLTIIFSLDYTEHSVDQERKNIQDAKVSHILYMCCFSLYFCLVWCVCYFIHVYLCCARW
jgi:hypothetical protein